MSAVAPSALGRTGLTASRLGLGLAAVARPGYITLGRGDDLPDARTPDALYAIRDPYGFRPLTLGRLDASWVVASETCALDLMEAKTDRDVEPGEIVVISEEGLRSIRALRAARVSPVTHGGAR